MRTILIAILSLGLVAAAAVPALAQPGAGAGNAADHQNETGRQNATARHEAAMARHDELMAARQAVLESFKENRSAVLAEYRASLNATRTAFIEAKADVLEACNLTRAAFTNNSNSTDAPDHAKCVSDGLKPLIEEARAANKAAREEALSKLQALRASGLSAWAKSLREANEHYRARTGEAPGA